MARPLSSGLKQIRRTPYQALAAITLLCITFFVGYAFSFLLLGFNQILHYFETRPQVIAFFKASAPDDVITNIGTTMRGRTYVSGVKITTKEEALQLYQEDNKKNPLNLELVTANLLPASIEVGAVDVTSLEQIQKDLQQYTENIDEIVYQKDIIDMIMHWTNAIRFVGLFVTGVLIFASVLTILTMVSMKVAMKKTEVGIMQLLGATSWYIYQPFLFEGAVYGFLGSMGGWALAMIALLYATPWILQFGGVISLLPVPPMILLLQSGIGTLFGIFLGMFSSLLALHRFRK